MRLVRDLVEIPRKSRMLVATKEGAPSQLNLCQLTLCLVDKVILASTQRYEVLHIYLQHVLFHRQQYCNSECHLCKSSHLATITTLIRIVIKAIFIDKDHFILNLIDAMSCSGVAVSSSIVIVTFENGITPSTVSLDT
ncbi:Uncharacterized protein TCM_045958 [Theobroma cacao]|uniref:Uncharacterized protein n=1 Tax=Theobroma cacao TaxID=3641 RepID=S1RW80_THECC|nr:Uncharacterized protein TCM_045958 [Theobroma cacao]